MIDLEAVFGPPCAPEAHWAGLHRPRRLQRPDGWLPLASDTVRAWNARSIELVRADRAAMLRLPPLAPAHGFAARVRLPRDYYVPVAGNDHSVMHPTSMGRMVEVTADFNQVRVHLDGRVVAEHRRAWGTALTVADPEHVAAAARARPAF